MPTMRFRGSRDPKLSEAEMFDALWGIPVPNGRFGFIYGPQGSMHKKKRR